MRYRAQQRRLEPIGFFELLAGAFTIAGIRCQPTDQQRGSQEDDQIDDLARVADQEGVVRGDEEEVDAQEADERYHHSDARAAANRQDQYDEDVDRDEVGEGQHRPQQPCHPGDGDQQRDRAAPAFNTLRIHASIIGAVRRWNKPGGHG
ncbi:MAG: hypothetical protein L6Q98_00650 [Anaerolineae bacterium]|nr:hypothetical protein [Anaerolineae bacterium]